jgi:hypothetical protein
MAEKLGSEVLANWGEGLDLVSFGMRTLGCVRIWRRGVQ